MTLRDTTRLQHAAVQHTTVRDMTAHYTQYTTPQLQLQLHHINYIAVQLQLHYTTTIATAALHDTTSKPQNVRRPRLEKSAFATFKQHGSEGRNGPPGNGL